MTRKDYVLIANAIKEGYDGQDNVRDVIENIASALSRDNNLFDTEKFLTACGVRNV